MSDDGTTRGGLVALAMTGAVVLAAFLLIGGLQDPDRPMDPGTEQRLEEKRATFLAEKETPTACGAESLELVGAALNAKGEPGTTFSADQDLRVAVAIRNPCPTVVRFQTPTACLAPTFRLTRPDGTVQEGGQMCAQMISDWEVQPQGAQRASFAIGNLPPGAYSIEIPVPGLDGSGKATFTVE